MKYKITKKYVWCDTSDRRVDCYDHTIFECLKCPNRAFIEDSVGIYTQEDYLNLLKNGNVYITKVEIV